VVRKVLRWGGIGVVIFFVAYRPQSAGQVVKSIGGGIVGVAQGFGDFFSSLVS